MAKRNTKSAPFNFDNVDFKNPHNTKVEDRWSFYLELLKLYWNNLQNKDAVVKSPFVITQENSTKDSYSLMDIQILKKAVVIGMTTTCSARMKSTLEQLKCPIIIVEEAAEVLEAHVVASLTKSCQHLILLGDHQQLQPSTADEKIGKVYQLGISLFERMVMNNVHLNKLNTQYRMRPEISILVTKIIYPFLQNGPNVYNRKSINGITKNIYFVNHKHEEASSFVTSKKNCYEAAYVVNLAKYLVLNGYNGKQITILSTYAGQKEEIFEQLVQNGNGFLKGVNVSTLDSYQGEENDIILLSLVRSNANRKIGFLALKNRICVLLSRARDGFFVVGNINMLAAANGVGADFFSFLFGCKSRFW